MTSAGSEGMAQQPRGKRATVGRRPNTTMRLVPSPRKEDRHVLDDDPHRREVVTQFVAARVTIDRVIATLRSGSRDASGSLRRDDLHSVSDTVADSIAALDKAFEFWIATVENPPG